MADRTKHRFFVPNIGSDSLALTLPERVSSQVNRVLRMRAGDVITLFSGDGFEVDAEIITQSRTSVRVALQGEPRPGIVAGHPAIHLGQALLKSDRFDRVVQKATELGVTSVTAVENERCVVSLSADRAQSRCERWQRIAIEALEQSERSDYVTVRGPENFNRALSSAESGVRIIAAERTGTRSLREVIGSGVSSITVMIGPEGGFTDRELEAAEAEEFIPVSLGPTILRSETAGIASVAMIRALAGLRFTD
jgi:16S rRNA (uracil1498-N3)-methyltransferase